MTKDEANIELESIKSKRGEIITNFAYIELVMKNICSTYYLGKIDEKFVTDILEDEYFSFGLLTRIIEKIAMASQTDFSVGKLKELSKYRNIIAHARVGAVAIVDNPDVPSVLIQKIVFNHAGKEQEVSTIFSKYDELKTIILENLSHFPGGKQIKVHL